MPTPESELLKIVMNYLAAERIFAIRMNTGAIKLEKRFIRFGVPGMADVLAFPWYQGVCKCEAIHRQIHPLWLELKAKKNKQSDLQVSFQAQVQAEGHRYFVIRSLDDLKDALR